MTLSAPQRIFPSPAVPASPAGCGFRPVRKPRPSAQGIAPGAFRVRQLQRSGTAAEAECVLLTPPFLLPAGRACARINLLLQAVASCFPVMAHKASCSWIALLPALLPMALTLPAPAHHLWPSSSGTQSIERSAKNTKSDPDANLWNEIATVPVSSEAKTLKNEVMLNKIFAGTPGSVWENIPDDFSYRHDYYIYGKALAATILPMGRKSTSDVMPQAHESEPRSLPWYPVRHA